MENESLDANPLGSALQGNQKGGYCCSVCYTCIFLGFVIWPVVALATRSDLSDDDISSFYSLLFCMTFFCLWCFVAIIFLKLQNNDTLESLEHIENGGTVSSFVLQSFKREPWRLVLGYLPCLALVILGLLGLRGTITNMPHSAAMAALITGGSLMGYCLCYTFSMIFCIRGVEGSGDREDRPLISEEA